LLYQERGSAAAIHLFRVACGLDSAILGDVQILGQVKRALALAAGAGTVGRTLRQLYQRAIRAGKRAREKTAIGSGAASIGSALASMMANGLLESKNEPNILIIGAGKVARDIAHHFAKRRIGKLTIINRTLAAAMDLAAACGGKSLAWASLPDALVHCHCAIAATAASTPILRWELLERVARARMERPLLVVDTGLPRNVEKGAPVDLIDIDEIREQQAVHLANRLAAVPDVERIVASELQSWQRWVAALPIEEVIKQVYEEASRQSRLTAQQLVQCGPISERHAAEFIQRSYKKLLHAHVQQLRRLSAEIPRGTKYGPAVESPP
jgi:glutamyl-tRNA reductase